MKHIILVAVIASILILAAACSTTTRSITGTTIKSDTIKAEEPQTPSIPDTCTDSDNGIDEKVKGEVSGVLNGEEYKLEDNCIRRQMLIEYYCDGSQYKNKNIACPCFEDVC